MAVTTLNSSQFVESTETDTAIVFCNGLGNSHEDAEASASLVSRAFGGREVSIFYNPTTLDQYLNPATVQRDHEAELIRQLFDHIVVAMKEKTKTLIIAHSHGAVLAKRAIEKLSDDQRGSIHLFAFGGATVIPKNLAGRVVNCFFEDDLISEMGNNIDEIEKRVLQILKRIHKLSEEHKCSLEDAVPLSALQVLIDMGQKKSEKFLNGKVIDVKELKKDSRFIDLSEEYRRCIQDYEFKFIKSKKMSTPKFTKLQAPRDSNKFTYTLSAITGNVIKGTVAAAEHVSTNHIFSSYEPALREVATEEFAK